MKHLALAATALTLTIAAPAAAQTYAGGTANYTGIGADPAYPDQTFDIVDFTPIAGTYAGPGTYNINDVTFTIGLNRVSPAPFGGVFTLTGTLNGSPVSYDVNYSGTINTADSITLGGNYLNIGGTGVHINPLTLGGGIGTYEGILSATVGGVPEPATWALMILGFGAVGFALRRRTAGSTSVTYA
ncbi:FxDxF family PEP-CTERM protein [Sphingomonas sp.]|uniref:FxDxF family PEP-CTERM protein n=1 Tax=Sphingomonas sp. TaxID=28214 RepID=UPI003B00ADCA